MMDEPPKKRPLSHKNAIPSARILNALPVKKAREIYDRLAEKSFPVNNCLFPVISLKDGEYPRFSLSKENTQELDDEELKGLVLAKLKGGKVRVPYHLLAWRASGKTLLAFEDHWDISHTCRRGQMATGEQGSHLCSKVQYGCFSMKCLEQVSHEENLDKGRCEPIICCPYCKLLFKNCKHEPICGTNRATEEALKKQGKVKVVRVYFEDRTLEAYSAEDFFQ